MYVYPVNGPVATEHPGTVLHILNVADAIIRATTLRTFSAMLLALGD